MLHLELPHVNVLSKIDLIAQYGDLGMVHVMLALFSRLVFITTSYIIRFQFRLLHRGTRSIPPAARTRRRPPTEIRRLEHGND